MKKTQCTNCGQTILELNRQCPSCGKPNPPAGIKLRDWTKGGVPPAIAIVGIILVGCRSFIDWSEQSSLSSILYLTIAFGLILFGGFWQLRNMLSRDSGTDSLDDDLGTPTDEKQ